MGTGEWRLRGDPTAGRSQVGGPLVVAVAGEGDRRADADDRREQRRRGEEADAKRRTRSGEGRGRMKWGLGFRGGAPAAYIAVVPRLIQRLGGADPTAGRKPGRGTGGGSWQAGPASCRRPGRLRVALYQAVPQAGPTGRDGGPGTKRPSAGPALSTMDRASCRARAVLFRVVPRAANRARPIWKSIASMNRIPEQVPLLRQSDSPTPASNIGTRS
jgi:hypothetical protein